MFYPKDNSIFAYGDASGRCLKPKSADVGSKFTTAKCDLEDLDQSFCWMEDGTIRLQSDEMKCMVSADEENREADLYKARDLTIALCDTTLDKHKLWQANDLEGVATTSGPGCVLREFKTTKSGAVSLTLGALSMAVAAIMF